jgi:branched-subunit amino acid transport protein
MTWPAVAVLAAGTYAFRLAGPLLRRRVRLPEPVQRYLSLAAVALLAALVATAAWYAGTHFAGWARPAGVLVGAVLAWRRLPFVVVVVAAALTTALLRLAGVG